MSLSFTHRNTPKTQGLELVAGELPFMSVPTLKPWQGKAPEPVPTLCSHPKFPPPALFLNIASPSKSPPWRNKPKFNFGSMEITKQSISLLPQPHQSALSEAAGVSVMYKKWFWGCCWRRMLQVPKQPWCGTCNYQLPGAPIPAMFWQHTLCPVPLQSCLCAFRITVKCSL